MSHRDLLLQGGGQGVTQELPALAESDEFAAIEQLTGGGGGGRLLELHSQSQRLLKDDALEWRLRNDRLLRHRCSSERMVVLPFYGCTFLSPNSVGAPQGSPVRLNSRGCS